jgi:hypothetical protein
MRKAKPGAASSGFTAVGTHTAESTATVVNEPFLTVDDTAFSREHRSTLAHYQREHRIRTAWSSGCVTKPLLTGAIAVDHAARRPAVPLCHDQDEGPVTECEEH